MQIQSESCKMSASIKTDIGRWMFISFLFLYDVFNRSTFSIQNVPFQINIWKSSEISWNLPSCDWNAFCFWQGSLIGSLYKTWGKLNGFPLKWMIWSALIVNLIWLLIVRIELIARNFHTLFEWRWKAIQILQQKWQELNAQLWKGGRKIGKSVFGEMKNEQIVFWFSTNFS